MRIIRILSSVVASATPRLRLHTRRCQTSAVPSAILKEHDTMATSTAVDLSQFTLPNDTGFCLLECAEAFKALTPKEKLYTHFLSKASWYGGLICLFQTSAESPELFVFFQKLFRHEKSVEQLKQAGAEAGLTEQEVQAFLIYVAGVYGNYGNYKSFGDTKIIPNLSQDKLDRLLEKSSAFQAEPEKMRNLWNSVKEPMYRLDTRSQQLNLNPKGITTYFSYNCTEEDAKFAQEFLDSKELSPYNTRLFKRVKDGKTVYEIRLASAKEAGTKEGDDREEMSVLGQHEFKGAVFTVTRGDYSALMDGLAENLKQANRYAANETEAKMLAEYVVSFTQGSLPAHKEGSRYWIRNTGPIVETYIGFIESYRDPFGVRGEFEGFVACVNKPMSAKFTELVNKAEDFLPLLPWSSGFEKDKFLRPDFTSLDVVAFGSSGIPAGINIPNYDDIRQNEGFKNVSLGNVLSSNYKAESKVTFLGNEDKELFSKLKIPSFEVQVGLHELLGHGSGKLLSQKADGSLNFDKDKIINPLTNKAVESWYSAKETWDSKFQAMSATYEECRAECVGIYLCLSEQVLEIFGHTGSQAEDIIYINWLNMVRAGLLALEFYTPESNKWRQAHMQARFVILRVLLEAGEGLVTIARHTSEEDGQPDLTISLDRGKIKTVGKKVIGDFLLKLQVYKATADYDSAKSMYDRYSDVNDRDEPKLMSMRPIVLARKQPRKLFVQCNTRLSSKGDGDTELQEYSADATGMIQSFRERYDSAMDSIITVIGSKDADSFKL